MSQGSLDVSGLRIAEVFYSLNFNNPQSLILCQQWHAFNLVLKSKDTKWASLQPITPCVNSFNSTQACHFFCCREHIHQEDQSGWRNNGKSDGKRGKKREKRQVRKYFISLRTNDFISCRETSSKQSTKDAEATTGLPTHPQWEVRWFWVTYGDFLWLHMIRVTLSDSTGICRLILATRMIS